MFSKVTIQRSELKVGNTKSSKKLVHYEGGKEKPKRQTHKHQTKNKPKPKTKPPNAYKAKTLDQQDGRDGDFMKIY